MTTRAVHWHEGMFIRPQHFQSAQRYWAGLVERSARWDVHYNWGLRALDLDLDALGNYSAVVRSLRARLRDGTLLEVPQDGQLAPLDLRGAFDAGGSATLYLGVPVLHLGRANATGNSDADARYLVSAHDLEDENTGVNPQQVQLRRPNFRLLLDSHDQAGLEILPLARIQRSARAEATPELDTRYIPPVLACDAWEGLNVGIVRAAYERIGKKIETLAEQVVSRGITFDSQGQGDSMVFAQLRELNEAQAVLGVLAFTEGVHPLTAYLELCRAVGQMAIFGATRRPPDLPRYDHDDLAGCFFRIKQHLDALLDIFVEPQYKERPFMGAGLRLQVTLEPAWLESRWQMFLGVQSQLEPAECIKLLTKAGQLDMKIGSSERVDTIFREGLAGLRVGHTARPPRALPQLPGQVYFQVQREASMEEWQHVARSLTLAMRLNERLILGNIQGQRVLTIKAATRTTPLQFTLYVVPNEAV
ncbi:MAG: type VI secretion system baseplate subunit TssK [Gemmataceae bacterium]|nr:type VI secretion system baseplate subunit TssK [Gemmataceae bacterium]